MSTIGEQIINTIESIKDSNVSIEKQQSEDGVTYILSSNRYRAEIIVNPKKWLGFKLNVQDQNKNLILTYDLDTDLYDISNPKYEELAKGIEKQISEILTFLVTGRIKVGEIEGRPAMIIPNNQGGLLIKKGRFFLSSEQLNDIRDIEIKGGFEKI